MLCQGKKLNAKEIPTHLHLDKLSPGPADSVCPLKGLQVTKERENLPRLCREKEESNFPPRSALTPEAKLSPRGPFLVKSTHPKVIFQELEIFAWAGLEVIGKIMPPPKMSLS